MPDSSMENRGTAFNFKIDTSILGKPKYRWTEDGLCDLFTDHVLSLDREKFSSRIINHWESNGLFNDPRIEKKGWRKFSLMEVIWLFLIHELRSFGFPLEGIRKVKECLQAWDEKNLYAALEYFIAYSVSYNHPIYLFVGKSGEGEILSQNDFLEYFSTGQLTQGSILINILEILNDLFPDRELKGPTIPNAEGITLSEEEMKLIANIRLGTYSSINIKMQDGQMNRIEYEESINNAERVINILNSSDYQDIEIKKRDGKIVKITRTQIEKV